MTRLLTALLLRFCPGRRYKLSATRRDRPMASYSTSISRPMRTGLALAALALGAAFGPKPAEALTFNLVNTFNNVGEMHGLVFDILNDDSSTIYDALEMGSSFMNALWTNPYFVNQAAHGNDFANFMTSLNPQFYIDYGISDVKSGWTSSTNTNTGVTRMDNIGGIPGVNYDTFDFGKTMSGTYAFNSAALISGVTFHASDPGGNSIGMTFAQNTHPFGIAYASVDAFPANTLTLYGTSPIPEPKTTGVLLALVALATAGLRRQPRLAA